MPWGIATAIAMLPNVSTALAADVIFLTCGPSSGYTYYMEGGLAKKTNVVPALLFAHITHRLPPSSFRLNAIVSH